jgi:DNA helicase HerA-like ATPase
MDMTLGHWLLPPVLKEKYGTPHLPVVWNTSEVINGHILIAGGSGTGKTHSIRKIIREMLRSSTHPIRIHLFDVHDDIVIDGASDIIFSEATKTGLNPLQIDPDLHTGGIRKAIQNFINTINKTSRKLGDRQEAVLRALMEDLYTANGFIADNPATWLLDDGVRRQYAKKYPNINDLQRWAYFKYKQMFIGGNSKAASALDRLNKESTKLQRFLKENGEHTSANETRLDELKDEANGAYSAYINSIKTGSEIDELLKFDSKSTLKSVVDRIDNLRSCGIFSSTNPTFDQSNPVWRYRIKHLGSEEKKMFVYFRLRELYYKALQRGLQDNIVEVIVIDEANMFMDSDPDNIISIMANEIRKFGTALICASQSFAHFSDDFLGSAATKIVLGIDEMYWDKTIRQLKVSKELLDWITPRRSALITMKRDVKNLSDKTASIRWLTVVLSP